MVHMKQAVDPALIAQLERLLRRDRGDAAEPMRPHRIVQTKHGHKRFMMKLIPSDDTLKDEGR